MEDENPFDGHELEDEAAVDLLMGWDTPACATCGAPLSGDPDDAAMAGAGGQVCDACDRARSADVAPE